MNEFERRIAATEFALIEVLACLPREKLDEARARITIALAHAGDADEVAAREGALSLLKEAEDVAGQYEI